MKIYLVGGAVRNQVMGLPCKDRDWVVVGATPGQMLAAGYKQVGRDFPVFLHPRTKEEYALARKERKVAPGHHGFECHFGIDVSLTDDLVRRDLTINAIAQDDNGHISDPYQGMKDIKDKVLKHVSDAFSEDPLRVFRVARFQATFPDFTVAAETMSLMREMVASGSCATLPQERIIAELEKALLAPAPWLFFSVLAKAGYEPEVCQRYQPEHAAKSFGVLPQGADDVWRWCACLWEQDNTVVSGLASWGLPNRLKRLCLTYEFWHICHQNHRLTDSQWENLCTSMDAFRRPETLAMVLRMRDRLLGLSDAALWGEIEKSYKQVNWPSLLTSCDSQERSERVKQEKCRIIRAVCEKHSY